MAPNKMLTQSGISRKRTVDTQDFVAVILVGYGESLYPFNEGTRVSSKAMMPVGNIPVINIVLDWVIAAGLTDILMIVPPVFYSAISNHLAENFASNSHPKLRIDLKRHTDGEKDEDEQASESTLETKAAGTREGTARLLRRFRSSIKSDFVLLPCDLAPPPGLTLASLLDKHRASPEAVLTALLYEPVEAVKEDEESFLIAYDKHSDELLLAEPLEGMEDELESRIQLMTSHPSLTMSTRLLDAHVYIFRRTILDLLATRRPRDLASIREQVVPWLIKGAWQEELAERWTPILCPPKRDIFASALARSTTATLGALSSLDQTVYASPSSDRHTSLPPTVAATPRGVVSPTGVDQMSNSGILARIHSTRKASKSSRPKPNWKCQAVVIAPEPEQIPAPTTGKGKDKSKAGPAEPAYLIRANSLAGYWELNRRFLRTMPPSKHAQPAPGARPAVQPPPTTATAPQEETDQAGQAVQAGPPISPSAQISPDTLIGDGVRIGERATLKKCVVGRHCVIGRGAKLTGCVLWDFVTVGENARIENAILCSNVRIGDKAGIKDCEFGTGFEAMAGVTLKGERLVAGQEA